MYLRCVHIEQITANEMCVSTIESRPLVFVCPWSQWAELKSSATALTCLWGSVHKLQCNGLSHGIHPKSYTRSSVTIQPALIACLSALAWRNTFILILPVFEISVLSASRTHSLLISHQAGHIRLGHAERTIHSPRRSTCLPCSCRHVYKLCIRREFRA